MARKANVTGIAMLSIGTTKNDKQQTLTRYSVNHNNKCKSFYFGVNNKQISAFKKAIEYMIENELYDFSLQTALKKYKELNHEKLIC